MDNNLVLVKCLDIMSDHNVKLAGHIQNLVGQCLMTDCFFQPCCSKLVLQITNGFVYATLVIELACAPSTNDL